MLKVPGAQGTGRNAIPLFSSQGVITVHASLASLDPVGWS